MTARVAGFFRAILPVMCAAVLIDAARADARVLPAQSVAGSAASLAKPHKAVQQHLLVIRVTDETGAPVPFATIRLIRIADAASFLRQTDDAGRAEFDEILSGDYQARVEKQGFYATAVDSLHVSGPLSLELTLNHQQEFAESINVVDSAKAIEPEATARSEQLAYRDIINLPYPTTRDIRAALPFLPGVLPDPTGQIHLAGAETYQILDQLDGFNITDPINGRFEMRVSVDGLRAVEVQSGRYSVEYGKGSGLLSLTSGMGDNHFRFSATNFVPSFQTTRGLSLNDWTPRATFSGPIKRDKVWFFESGEFEYKSTVVDQLPRDADTSTSWRVSSLTRVQANLSQTNIMTASFLINDQHAGNAGLSPFRPKETTRDEKESAYLITLKDEAFFSNGVLLNAGLGLSHFRSSLRPQGEFPFFIRPEGTSGNFYLTSDILSRRVQVPVNATLPGVDWHGRHQIKIGADVDLVTSDQLFDRRDIFILREDGTLSRKASFSNAPRFEKNNLLASAYAQDRWSLSERLLLELGLRLDRDGIVRGVALSPRLAATYLLTSDGATKLSAGAGIFRDQTNLDFITRPRGGTRLDLFYDASGQNLDRPPVTTALQVNESALRGPWIFNWSAGIERRLPGSIYASAQFLEKRGRNGFAFERATGQLAPGLNLYVLGNGRRDSYDSFEISARRTFKSSYLIFASYTRSAARSNAVLDFTLDNLLFSPQRSGPLSWDVPNRLLSWGWLPLIKGFDLAYSLDWRDGYPFNVVDQNQMLVGQPGSRRFPAYFSLNIHVERRFKVLGGEWALRVGVNNVTDRDNPAAVNNNIDSPQFLTFGATQHRVFTGRIRFLGRK